MVRRLWNGVIAVALALCLSPAMAGAEVVLQGGEIRGVGSEPIKMVTVTADTDSAGSFQAGSLILGFKMIAESANAQCTLYDSATVGAGTNATVIDEAVEPTDEETAVHIWPFPYKLVTDLSIDVTTVRACIVYYQ